MAASRCQAYFAWRLHASGPIRPGHREHAGRQHDGLPRRKRGRRRLRIGIDAALGRRRRRAGILLTTSKGGTVTGQLAFDGPRPTSLGSIRITSVPADSDGPTIGGLGAREREKTTVRSSLKGLTGLRLIRLGNAPPGWTLKSVKLNGTDITDNGAEFKPGETTSGLEVELTNRSTSVNGNVTASDGSLLKDYTVVIFSETPEQWRFPMTRWVTGTRPDQDGRFKVQSLPVGNYLAVAVDYVPQGEWGDPELLDRLKSRAKRSRSVTARPRPST